MYPGEKKTPGFLRYRGRIRGKKVFCQTFFLKKSLQGVGLAPHRRSRPGGEHSKETARTPSLKTNSGTKLVRRPRRKQVSRAEGTKRPHLRPPPKAA